MKNRYQNSPKEVISMNSQELRENFLIETLFEKAVSHYTYSHYDRVIIGGICPAKSPIFLENFEMLKSEYFLERRELGILNIGGNGTVFVGNKEYFLDKLDCLYVGKGEKTIKFTSENLDNPAKFYLLSTSAHQAYPTALMKLAKAFPVVMGSGDTSNHRTIYKYIHKDGIASCQLVLGLTILEKGSVWNTMPAHVHDRRTEVYCYFDLNENQIVMHFMGQPHETRHIVVANNQAVISAPWFIHSGCGTSNYSFIWGMAGENQDYTDMDLVNTINLK